MIENRKILRSVDTNFGLKILQLSAVISLQALIIIKLYQI